MKIRNKLTLRYIGITAAIFALVLVAIYLFSERTREREFYRGLTKEAVTKANLFLSGRVDAGIMQSIYRNNRKFIDEVEVAVYTQDFKLLYHDAQEIDIIKETPGLLQKVIARKNLSFYEDDYQAIAMLYRYGDKEYILTAAAHDGYGYAKLQSLAFLLGILLLCGLIVLILPGYLLARGALSPISRIVKEVDSITGSNLNTRLAVKNEHDELDELSETFNRMLNRLEHSFNNQKMFVSNVAHELRTPLAALIAELEVTMLREERTSQEYRAALTNALHDARNLKQLTSGLLDLAKANYDASQIATEELRLDELLLDARETVLKAHQEYAVKLLFSQDTDDDQMITIRGNAYLLKTALVNLIENNCKFSADKTSHVQIAFYEKNSIVRFSDTGTGIDTEDLDHIFTPFYRGKNKSLTHGQGIGMALVQRIIQLHKGTISVHSHPGEGTVFLVEIPHI